MAADTEALQLIARLTPLADVLAMIDAEVKPVTPRPLDVAAALGHTLAADVTSAARPAAPIALTDGWAIAADLTLGAGGYSPVLLTQWPTRVEAGQVMPPGADSVAPFDAVKTFSGRAEVLVSLNPGDGMLPVGGDCESAMTLRRAGERIRITDIAAFAVAGLTRVTVREPRIRVFPLRGSALVAAAAQMIAADVERRGGSARVELGRGLDGVLAAASENSDAIIAIGGTGSGRNDSSVHVLARGGRLAVHGFALAPGETAALGFSGKRPILLLPGRLDAALSVWMTVGRALLERLCAAKYNETPDMLTLIRKVTSTVGGAELVPVRRAGNDVEPLASRYLPLSSLTRSDGWILVPAESEGYPAGTPVAVRPWP
jgi:molybdopterin molybdotransferase